MATIRIAYNYGAEETKLRSLDCFDLPMPGSAVE
jgi:hypothetical protein